MNEQTIETQGHTKTHDIVVNGRPRTFAGPRISYNEIVHLAFPEGPFDVLYTVSYANPHGKDGTLAPGQDVSVKEGMSFNVGKTNRS